MHLLSVAMSKLVPGRLKVPLPCPPALLAGREDRLPLVAIGAGALVLLVSGRSDALSLENVFGTPFATGYLVVMTILGIFAAGANCVLTLGHLMRVWGVVVVLLASSAIVVKTFGALLPVAFYLVLGYMVAKRGHDLIKQAHNLAVHS